MLSTESSVRRTNIPGRLRVTVGGQGGAQDCAPDPINRIAETIQLTEAHGCREAPCELWQFAAHLRDALM